MGSDTLRATATAGEPRPQILPRNGRHRSRLQLPSAAFDFGRPSRIDLSVIVLFKTIQKSSRDFGAILLGQLQRLPYELFNFGIHSL
jgi:hypothetical protein